ncbi:hypothetical protein ES705_44277 [subsurface metagenome]
MITEIEAPVGNEPPVFTFEFKQIYDAVRKFKDYFMEHHSKWGIPPADLMDIQNYVSALEDRKFGDIILSKDQKNLVEALRLIGSMASSVHAIPNLRLYQFKDIWDCYLNPCLQKYYMSYLTGYKSNFDDNIEHRSLRYSFTRYQFGTGWLIQNFYAPPFVGALEGWFFLNRYFGTVEVTVYVYYISAPADKMQFAMYFIKSGVPLSKGSLFVGERGDVNIVGQYEWTPTQPIGTLAKIFKETIVINDDVMYFVPCLFDPNPTKGNLVYGYYVEIVEI